MRAKPPITPPTIGPTGGPLLLELEMMVMFVEVLGPGDVVEPAGLDGAGVGAGVGVGAGRGVGVIMLMIPFSSMTKVVKSRLIWDS